MQLPYLVRAIESHAEELTSAVMAELRDAPELTSLNRFSDDELRARSLDLYANLSKWVGSRGDHDVGRTYRLLGERRCEDGVPAAELVFAVIAIKRRLWEFIRRNDAWESEVELYQEEELFNLVSHFFDVAIYSAVAGHESARAAGRWATSGRK